MVNEMCRSSPDQQKCSEVQKLIRDVTCMEDAVCLQAVVGAMKEIRKETPTLRGTREENWAERESSSSSVTPVIYVDGDKSKPCRGPWWAVGTIAIGEACDNHCECASGACGRKSAAAGRTTTCCKSGKSTWYGGYLYCKEMPKGYTCWSDEMCGSGYCKGNWYGTKKGKCT